MELTLREAVVGFGLWRLAHVSFSGLLAWAVLGASPALADESFALDSTHTIPGFEVQHFGITTQRGRFARAKGRAVLDIAGRKGSVFLVIDSGSIDIGSPTANRLLRSAAMLNVERFPSLTFESDHFYFDGDTVVGAEGKLTLLGVTKLINVTMSGFSCRTHPLVKRRMCGGDISATLRRSDFGMTEFLPDIGDVIRIDVPVESIADGGIAFAESEPRQEIKLRTSEAVGGEPYGRNGPEISVSSTTGNRYRTLGGSFF